MPAVGDLYRNRAVGFLGIFQQRIRCDSASAYTRAMARGRKPKAPHLRLIQGNTGHKAKDSRVTPSLPVDADAKPPRWLSKEARKHWRTLVPALAQAGLLSRLDGAQLAQYCATQARWIEAQIHLNNEPLMVAMPSGIVRPNAWFVVSNNLSAQLMRMGDVMGLNPAARARLKVDPPPSAADNAFAAYLERGRDRDPVKPATKFAEYLERGKDRSPVATPKISRKKAPKAPETPPNDPEIPSNDAT